ncbi:hypothetical protein J1605_020680 [Eschrichtius robustus]|uniref:TM2 domain-containing protein 3 n=1 Tax=Eschrichtius robustus TaxID=9764 RepID=A0AB34HK08_ESCRO|nr:hypothetical protein J1605_020680 [Eschrichtius robustus]MBV97163.1 TM2 domain-containing protein 3 [Eschrichtius robustus]
MRIPEESGAAGQVFITNLYREQYNGIDWQRYTANCTVRDHIHCLGNRTFPKMLYYNWTGGYKWSTALALTITLGGFGADSFYLGQWHEGLGKLFCFGGLGIWTLLDVLLAAYNLGESSLLL